MDKTFTIGSSAFFSGINGFKDKGTDTLVLVDNPQGYNHYTQEAVNGKATYKWARKPKADFMAYAMRERAYALEFGKFIVPDFAAEIGLTIDDLKTLYAFYENRIDEMHGYQKVICEAYIENNSFTLTDEQREAAYKAYREAREEAVTDKENEEQTNEEGKEE